MWVYEGIRTVSRSFRGYGGRPQSALQELMRPAKAHRRVDW